MLNKKIVVYVLMLVLILITTGCRSDKAQTINNTQKVTVAVSIVPQETFVKAVGGEFVDVITMIPPGYSPEVYQPTVKQIAKLSKSLIYFSIGVPSEVNIIPKLKDFNNNIKIVSLDEKVGQVYPHRYFDEDEVHSHEYKDGKHEEHKHGEKDPHIWLSPKRVKVMIEVIKDELIKLDPNNKIVYENNASNYISKLDEVDKEIRQILSRTNQRSFIIYHPSLGYFADDYGLKMVTIEEEGKEATAKKLQEVIDLAKKENIKFIFYQEEFDSNQAETIAKEIGGTTIKIAPLDANYIQNMKHIANKFKEVLK